MTPREKILRDALDNVLGPIEMEYQRARAGNDSEAEHYWRGYKLDIESALKEADAVKGIE